MKDGARVALRVDVGGTWVRAVLADDADRVRWILRRPTRKGLRSLERQLQGIAAAAEREARRRGWALAEPVTVGTPGRRIRRGGRRIIAHRSAENLCRRPGEFDGVPLEARLSKALRLRVVADNDAVAQMGYLLARVLRSARGRRWRGRQVAYIGPGTGLGGAFARISRSGRVRVRTDGHVGNLDPRGFRWEGRRGRTRLEARFLRDGLEVVIRGPHRIGPFRLRVVHRKARRLTVEDVCSGAGLREVVGRLAGPLGRRGVELAPGGRTDAETWSRAMLRRRGVAGDVARLIAEFAGAVLGEVFCRIHDGRMRKTFRREQWSARDAQWVKGTRTFLLGGSLTGPGPLGGILLRAVRRAWKGRVPRVSLDIARVRRPSSFAGALGTKYLPLWQRGV